jgi:hypothetical protein
MSFSSVLVFASMRQGLAPGKRRISHSCSSPSFNSSISCSVIFPVKIEYAWKIKLVPKPVRAIDNKLLLPKMSHRSVRTCSGRGSHSSGDSCDKIRRRHACTTSSCSLTLSRSRTDSINSGKRVSGMSLMRRIWFIITAVVGRRAAVIAA